MAVILLVGPPRDLMGGVTTHLDLLCASALAREHSYVHFTVGSPGPDESALRKIVRTITAPFAFVRVTRRSRAQLVHLNPSLDKSFWRDLPLILLAHAMRLPTVVQIHGGQRPHEFGAHTPGARALLRLGLRAASHLVVLARTEQAAFEPVLEAGRLHLIPNAIDVAPYAGSKPHPYDGKRPLRVIYLGRVVRSKGLFDACDALHRVLAGGTAAELLIAGDGPDAGTLAQYVKELGLAHAVRLVGPLHGAAKTAFLIEADVFLFPTQLAEGLPYSLLECMAAATPAVVTATGAIVDVVTDGVDGMLVSAHDVGACAAALTRLAASPKSLHAMARAARERVRTAYSLTRLERDFAALYRQALTPDRPAPAAPVEVHTDAEPS
ncbi:MAG TPA: glycosyltransferase [Burkholderiales bacterium]|jgi:glycosyltransferase involved in cell wall biosynthesis